MSSAAMISSSPRLKLIDRLRRERSNVDWRRERPHQGLVQFRIELEAEIAANTLSAAERIEACALMHRLALDPLATLIALIDVFEQVPRRSSATMRLLLELISQWNVAIGAMRGRGYDDDAVLRSKHVAQDAMRQLAERNPHNDDAQHFFIIFMRQSSGDSAVLQFIEKMNKPPQKIIAEYFEIMISILIRRQNSEALSHSYSNKWPAIDPVSQEFLRFCFHRAVATRMLMWNCDFRAPFADEALRTTLRSLPQPDPAHELDKIRRLLLRQPLSDQAAAVVGLCACPALWRCPGLEAVRLDLLELLMSIAVRMQDPDVSHRLLKHLLEHSPQTIAFWSGTGWPSRIHRFILGNKAHLKAGVYGSLLGLSAFAIPDLDTVKNAFQIAEAEGVTSSPQHTYLDPRMIKLRDGATSLNADLYNLIGHSSIEAPHSADIIVVTSADENYFRIYSLRWAQSLQASGSKADVHFHIIGNIDVVASEISAVRAALSGRCVTFSTENYSVQKAFYYATARFLHALRWLSDFRKTIIVTDIDVHWTLQPETLDQAVGDADVGLRIFDRVRHYIQKSSNEVILRYPRLRLWQCTSASCFLIRPTVQGQRFAGLLADVASQHLLPFFDKPGSHWFIDQNILSAVYAYAQRSEPEMRIENLDAYGLSISDYSAFDDERLLQSYGQHWITGREPFVSSKPGAMPEDGLDS